MNPIYLILFLFHLNSIYSLSCINPEGTNVDWWFGINPPEYSPFEKLLYFDKDIFLDARADPFTKILELASDKTNFFYMVNNYGFGAEYLSGGETHEKFIIIGKDGEHGILLHHTLSKFPYFDKDDIIQTDPQLYTHLTKYAQHLFCYTIKTDTIEFINFIHSNLKPLSIELKNSPIINLLKTDTDMVSGNNDGNFEFHFFNGNSGDDTWRNLKHAKSFLEKPLSLTSYIKPFNENVKTIDKNGQVNVEKIKFDGFYLYPALDNNNNKLKPENPKQIINSDPKRRLKINHFTFKPPYHKPSPIKPEGLHYIGSLDALIRLYSVSCNIQILTMKYKYKVISAYSYNDHTKFGFSESQGLFCESGGNIDVRFDKNKRIFSGSIKRTMTVCFPTDVGSSLIKSLQQNLFAKPALLYYPQDSDYDWMLPIYDDIKSDVIKNFCPILPLP